MPYTRDVFGLSANVREYSYIDRDNLDKKIVKLLNRDCIKHFQGKSYSSSIHWNRRTTKRSNSDCANA